MSNSTELYYDQCYFLGQQTHFITEYHSVYTTIIVINGLVCLPTIIGNLIIIIGIWMTPALQTVSNLLLIGLSCSDLGVGLIVPGVNIARNMLKLQEASNWCHVQVAYTFFGVMFCGVSFLTVAAFTIDKYLALHWHLRYVTIVTIRRVVFILISFWVIFGAMSTIQIWSMTAYRISVCFVVPLFLLGTSFTYVSIYRVLRRHNSQIQNQSIVAVAASNNSDQTFHMNMARYRKSVSSMFLVYCLFIFCYLPYICVQFTVLFTQLTHYINDSSNIYNYKTLYVAVDVTETIVILNSFLNPIVYCWRMREIRHAAKRLMMMLRSGTMVHPMQDSRTFTGTL